MKNKCPQCREGQYTIKKDRIKEPDPYHYRSYTLEIYYWYKCNDCYCSSQKYLNKEFLMTQNEHNCLKFTPSSIWLT